MTKLPIVLIAILGAGMGCEVRHSDLAFDLDVDSGIVTSEGRPIPKAVIRLDGEGVPSKAEPICKSDTDGRCVGVGSYRFGQARYRLGEQEIHPGSVNLRVEAEGFRAVTIPINRLTRAQLAGRETIALAITLQAER